MAEPQTSQQPITPPPGFELESPSAQGGITPPPGFELESPEPNAGLAPAEAPGFLDREIPLDSYTHATESGLQSIGRGFRSAYRGVKDTLDPNVHPGEEGLSVPDVPDVIGRPIIRTLRGIGETARQATEVPAAIHDINQSPDPLGYYTHAAQDTAGDAAAQAAIALATEGIARGIANVPKPLATAPVRALSRTTEGIVNSSPMRYVRGASRLFTPADEARKMIRVPGRDFGLDLPSNPGAPFPERPLPAVMQARGLQTGGYAPAEPSEALARIPTTTAEPETALAVRPRGKIGGRLVLTPEEVEQAEQIQKLAKRRASERGMQYAGGMKPSGAKVAAP